MKDILCSDRSCIRKAYSEDDAEPASEFVFFLGALDESLPVGLSSASAAGLSLSSTRLIVASLSAALEFANVLAFGSCHLGSSFRIF